MRRRQFITLIGGAVTAPLAAHGQHAPMLVIGFVSARSPEDSVNVLKAFHEGLREDAGFVENENVKVEYRWARGNYAALPALAGELVARRVDVLVAVGGDVSARAAKAATSTIPIVFTSSGNPVAAGLVQSINRPGGNATGCIVFSTSELNAKRLDFIREVVPGDSIVGILINPKYPTAADQARELEGAAAKIGRNIFIVEASDDAELKAAFGALLQKRVGALIVVWDPFIELRRQRIIAFAAENHLPDMYQLANFALDGGLISYGPSITDVYRQVGVYAGHILKGAKPSDLPIVLPTKYELVINLKTANALSLKVPLSLLVAADQIIE
jgi:putative tryptophan/tyrosine transport system substrate-binding protein